MPMQAGYLNIIADAGAAAITYIGLGDTANTEITGGSPAYVRKAVTWTASTAGIVRPTGNITFDIPAGVTVSNWKTYPSSVSTIATYGGSTLAAEVYAGQGQYILLAASTSITHTST
jgi:hypothetical protein